MPTMEGLRSGGSPNGKSTPNEKSTSNGSGTRGLLSGLPNRRSSDGYAGGSPSHSRRGSGGISVASSTRTYTDSEQPTLATRAPKSQHPWVVPVMPTPADQKSFKAKHGGPPPNPSSRLVFFPYGGGGPSACQSWVMPLAYAGIEVMAISLPGRGIRLFEPAQGSMQVVVEHIMAEIVNLMDKP
eukprot:CAMPEP_0198224888 /NCGR_PEP_ID=MMETSP1445-20131203/98729_1 /TAXON_ID=36898 /ORGANISM="Pyramimonas sp., Strain CCMP2087" /LENGTH=183 /DNA_ID=CAMNT_0043904205 /DNA_START=248 /DNA_END=796 /DNA_ORIENTATION=-